MTKLQLLENEWSKTIREVEYLYIVNEEICDEDLEKVIKEKEHKIKNLEIEIENIKMLERPKKLYGKF